MMYTGKFSFFILSGNRMIEEILSAVPPIEDCEYSFKTVDSLDFPIGLDCAVIAEGGTETVSKLKNRKSARLAAILPVSALTGDERRITDLADDLWFMPDDDIYNEAMLRSYFGRLVKAMKESFDYRRLRICFDTAFDSIPDLVWFKDTVGSHLKVNNGFCNAVEKTKEQIYKRGHYYIWDIPKEEYDQGEYVCLESEDVVMQARKTCLFDEKVKTKHGMGQFKTYKSPLIDEDGEIFGTCGIAHDVTDLHNIHRELIVVLESMPFGVIIEDRSGKVVSTNKKLCEMFPGVSEITGQNYREWKSQNLKNAKPYIHGGEEISLTIGGKNIIIWLREISMQSIFGESIGNIMLFSDITSELEYAKQTMHRANTDFLTGLNNRRSLFSYLNLSDREKTLTLIMIDLDNFKKVNDSYGHHMGDEALVATSQRLLQSFPDDFISRLGGDEFLVVVNREITLEQVEDNVYAFLDSLKETYQERKEFRIMTASVGVSQSTIEKGGRHDVEMLLRRSDEALYHAKNSGKNRLCVYGKIQNE